MNTDFVLEKLFEHARHYVAAGGDKEQPVVVDLHHSVLRQLRNHFATIAVYMNSPTTTTNLSIFTDCGIQLQLHIDPMNALPYQYRWNHVWCRFEANGLERAKERVLTRIPKS